jgi:HEAT repeat protein
MGEDAWLARLFRAHREGDLVYIIESLRFAPEDASVAAHWLADAGATEAIPELVRLLDVAHGPARGAAARALQRLGPPEEAKRRLVEMARTDDRVGTRVVAAIALGEYRDPALTNVLVELLDDPNWNVRRGAAAGLEKLGDPTALEPLRRGLRSLRWRPFWWYLNRVAYKKAIKALRG